MILSDRDIDNIIKNGNAFLINPYNEEMLQPNSYDCSLGTELKKLNGKCIDISHDSYKLKPNEFLLGSTMERVHLPRDLCGHVDGKSSIGRLGVFVHISSGFIDSGFNGNANMSNHISDIDQSSHKGIRIIRTWQSLSEL